MKQHIILIGLVFAMFAAYSQENNSGTAVTADTTKKQKDYCPHRIWVDFGMAYSNNIYNRFNKFEPKTIQQKYSFSNVLEVGYAYFFHPKMGVGLGIGLSKISAKALLGTNWSNTVPEIGYNPQDPNSTYERRFYTDNFAERQSIWAIEIPLTFQFETRLGESQRNGIFASLGVRGYFPISGRTHFPESVINQGGYEEAINVVWPVGMPRHFEPISTDGVHAKMKMRSSIDIIGNVGGLIGLTKKTDLYLGIYASYGFLDILPKEKVPYIQGLENGVPTVGGLTNSDILEHYNERYNDVDVSTKWNLFQAGIKVGLRFKPCGQSKQSLREEKRDFFETYGEEVKRKKARDEARDKKDKDGDGEDDRGKKPRGKKGAEQIYIVPIYMDNAGRGTSPDGGDYLSTLDPETDKEVIALIQALTDARIFFPLDKDVPINSKLATQEVEKAATILKANPNLKIIIDGYTCKLGTQSHNEDLAQRRANRIRGMFLDRGISSKQVETDTFTVENYPKDVVKTFHSLEDARTVIFRIIKD